jgi:CHRD domain
MRRILTLSLASTALLLVLGNLAAAQQIKRAEKLLGGNENPPVVTDATGNFRAELFADRIEYRLRYDVAAPDSDVTQAHLHIANPGNNGNIAAFLCSNAPGATPACPPSPGVVEGEIVAADVREVTDVEDPTVTILEAEDLDGLARLIRQGSVYANVHSVDHPGGEIRGQLSPRIR